MSNINFEQLMPWEKVKFDLLVSYGKWFLKLRIKSKSLSRLHSRAGRILLYSSMRNAETKRFWTTSNKIKENRRTTLEVKNITKRMKMDKDFSPSRQAIKKLATKNGSSASTTSPTQSTNILALLQGKLKTCWLMQLRLSCR